MLLNTRFLESVKELMLSYYLENVFLFWSLKQEKIPIIVKILIKYWIMHLI